MEFVFNCPHCHRQLAADESEVGQNVVCPACQQALPIPHQTLSAKPTTVGDDDDSIEIVEEFRLPSSEAPPPSHRDPSGTLPTMMPPPGRSHPDGRMRAKSEKQRRHHHKERPLQRRAFLTVVLITVLSCVIVATVIVAVTRVPGDGLTPWPSTPRKEPQVAQPGTDQNKLTPLEGQELAVLIIQAFGTLPPTEGDEAKQIFAKINQKQPTSEEQLSRFYALFQKGAKKLPASQGDRLAMLLKKSMPSMPVTQ